MLLSSLVNKEILSGKTVKGVCLGVGISLKNYTVKYLLCASAQNASSPDFAVSVSAVERIDDCVRLTKLRPLHPQNCARIFLGRPIYAFDGVFLGTVADLLVKDFTATDLFSDQNIRYPVSGITACHDAVILKKEQPYPLGQRIPAPLLHLANDKNSLVTKPVLRAAIGKGTLIKLTLSLPPFSTQELL